TISNTHSSPSPPKGVLSSSEARQGVRGRMPPRANCFLNGCESATNFKQARALKHHPLTQPSPPRGRGSSSYLILNRKNGDLAQRLFRLDDIARARPNKRRRQRRPKTDEPFRRI